MTRLPAEATTADLATDSGRRPHERGFPAQAPHAHLDRLARELFGADRWRATESGRGAEASIAAALLKPGMRVLANEVYVSGQWWIERLGATVEDLPAESFDHSRRTSPAGHGTDVAYVQLTLPPARLGPAAGRPVSLDRVLAVRHWVDRNLPHVPLVIDASRLWENAAADQADARHFAEAADIVLLSARKDIGAARGGLVLASGDRWWDRVERAVDLFEGPRGGLDDDDLTEIAAGLQTAAAGAATTRHAEVERLAHHLRSAGLTVISTGCGSIFLDAARWLPQVPADELPAQTLLNVIYLLTGWRGLGTSTDEHTQPSTVRLAVGDSAAVLREQLPTVAEFGQRLGSGLRPLPRDRGAPYLQPAEPTDPSAWPSSPRVPPSANAEWFVGRTPPGRGPQRALAEALSHHRGLATSVTDDPTFVQLYDRMLVLGSATMSQPAGAIRRIDDPSGWPTIADDSSTGIFWANEAHGGIIAVRARSPLATLLDRASLFTMGAWLTVE